MTVKDLAFFTDKNKSTIGRWVAKCNSREAIYKLQNATKDKPADFTVDEVEYILNASSLSKDAVLILIANAREAEKPSIGQMTQVVDYELLGKMIGEAVKAAVAPLYGVVPTNNEKPKMIEAPESDYRDMLRQIIMRYAKEHTSGDVREAWGVLYEELYYRCKISVRTRANNRGISKLDVIEEEGLLQKSYLIMIQMMGE